MLRRDSSQPYNCLHYSLHPALDWSCERNIILYLVLPHVKLTLQYWNGQTGHYDGPSNMSYNEMVFILSSYYRQLSWNSQPVTSPILFPPGQQKEGEQRRNYISKVEITHYKIERAKVAAISLIILGVTDTSFLSPQLLSLPKLAVFDSERKVLKFLYKSSMRIIRKSIKCKEKQVKSCHLLVGDIIIIISLNFVKVQINETNYVMT